ncbi:MAG: DUF2911 domain-containing protein [bacterium]|nr:DUF2911 domain-containing protein [bacterium]
MQVYVITTPRKSARVAWFSRTGSPGQISIDFAPIKWQDKYDEMVGSEKMMGKKWRLGADFWTAMDTSVDLSIGGQNVPAGYYYLTLEQQAEDRFVLGVHNAAKVKKMKLDAYLAHRLPSGIEIPLTHSRSDAAEKELDIKIATKPGSLDHGKFRIAFGGHRLVAPVAMMVGKKKAAEASGKKKVKF